ncbi:protein of unknown function [Pseudomonas inefficax]|uniref:Uncharacterized protein n=1 Tax=Pseudomonas inefficax TaxID=2078786 RepID=A0AAQ1P2E4_9PSED|nr:protein of unknown function [Pseudomonas inefficax]
MSACVKSQNHNFGLSASISSTLWDISLVVRTEGITDPEVASESIKPSGRLTTRSD